MARSLEQLQKQYNSSASSNQGMRMGGPGRGGPGGRGHGGRGGHGSKPKDIKATTKGLFRYIGKYKFLLLVVFLCMLISTSTSLIGGYVTRPVINKLAENYSPLDVSYDSGSGVIYDFLDNAIENFREIASPLFEKIAGTT